jgi:hypothetical protein
VITGKPFIPAMYLGGGLPIGQPLVRRPCRSEPNANIYPWVAVDLAVCAKCMWRWPPSESIRAAVLVR